MERNLTLNNIAGFTTERAVWRLIGNLAEYFRDGGSGNVSPESIFVDDDHFRITPGKCRSVAFDAPGMPEGIGDIADSAAAWVLGALAFFAVTGVYVFEGKGGTTQTAATCVPRIGSAHASRQLSDLIQDCLSFTPADRPDLGMILEMARGALALQPVPRKKVITKSGKAYDSPLSKFWPDEMLTLMLVLILSFVPVVTYAQGFGPGDIPDEMTALVTDCIDLRLPQNQAKVRRVMDRDMMWTLMDELAIDRQGECTTNDMVDMFGLNDLGYGILKRHGGISNAGGRFRDGRDPRYKYSLIEITVKKGATVSYRIEGREGEQILAVVPYDAEAVYRVSIPGAEAFTDDGVRYVQLRRGLKKTDSFDVSISNLSDRNMAFVIINYNSRNNE